MEPTQRRAAAERLCHVTTRDVVDASGGHLTDRPFLHCCTEDQLRFVLATHFAGRSGLVVLRFDPAGVEGRIEWERSEPDQSPFPHLFGALPVAITSIEPLAD